MAQPGSTPSPFRDGFAALGHEPALPAAELMWRWCFGLSALALAVFSVALFLDTLKVTPADEFLLRTWNPSLWLIALRHVFAGSLSRFAREQIVLVFALILLWSLAATIGGAAVLSRLVAMFRTEEEAVSSGWRFAPLFLLKLLRGISSLVALALAAGLFLYGTAMAHNEHAIRATLALSFGLGLVCAMGFAVNWYLSVAPLFCIRNAAGVIEALDQALAFSIRHSGRLFLLGVGFSGLRLVWTGTMFLAFLSPLRLIHEANGRWAVALMALALLVYFAGVDLLRLARMGAYVSLAEDDLHPAPAPVLPMTPDSGRGFDLAPNAGLT